MQLVMAGPRRVDAQHQHLLGRGLRRDVLRAAMQSER